jgi:hypothetical protein
VPALGRRRAEYIDFLGSTPGSTEFAPVIEDLGRISTTGLISAATRRWRAFAALVCARSPSIDPCASSGTSQSDGDQHAPP